MNKNLKIKDVEIFLDRDRKVFEMGEMVHGKLRITLTGELYLTTLQIGVVCMSKIKNADDTFDQKKLLEEFYELPRAVSSQILKSGRHEIPFRFRLPDDSESPPSFDGRYGCINYFVECVIEKEENYRYGVEIKLENPVKKNLLLSVSGSSEKDLGIFCFGSGTVSIEANIARKGHVAGEIIKLKTLINNTSTLKVQPRAALYQTQIFMSGDRHRTLEIVLVEPINGSEVDPTEVIEDIIEIPIPSRAQLTIKSIKSIITIKYYVHVTLDIPHNIDIHINLPIVITTKSALREAQDQLEKGQQHQSCRKLNSFEGSAKSRKILGIASKTRQASTSSSNFDDLDDLE